MCCTAEAVREANHDNRAKKAATNNATLPPSPSSSSAKTVVHSSETRTKTSSFSESDELPDNAVSQVHSFFIILKLFVDEHDFYSKFIILPFKIKSPITKLTRCDYSSGF